MKGTIDTRLPRVRADGTAVAAHVGLFVGYFLAVRLGMEFVLPQANISLVWPASGVALAAVYLLGSRFAVTVTLAAFAAHFVIEGEALPAAAVSVGAGIAAGLGAWLLHRSGFRPGFRRPGDVLRFVVYGALVSSAVSSLTGAGVMVLAGAAEWQGFGSLWWVCWVADLTGILFLSPLIMAWSVLPRPALDVRALAEVGAMAAGVLLAGWVVYSDVLPPGLAMSKPLSYLVFPLMIWAALRAGPRETTALLLVHAALAVAYTADSHGPFAGSTLRENLLSLHAHLGMLSVTTLLLASTVSERARAEKALRESEAKYRLLVENQTDLVVKMDRDGRILFASPTVAETFGESPDNLIGRPFRLLVRKADEGDPDSPWSRLFRPPWSCYLEQPVQTTAGSRWLGWAAKAVREADGAPCAVVAVGRDITERRRAEEASRQYLQELAHVGRVSAMGEMAAGLAHELNQPLCAITTFSQACQRLLGPDADPQLTRAMARVAANAQRAGEIIRQMRSFVRKDDPQAGPADINSLIRDVLELTAADLRHARVQVIPELGDALPPVWVAEIQIHQVLVNLIRNAAEAMAGRESGENRLSVTTGRTAGGQVEVIVADTGPGLPAEMLDSVFEPFVSGKANGMGLGLSISRSIVESHGGQLTARNRPGGGAEFRFQLPVAESREAQAG